MSKAKSIMQSYLSEQDEGYPFAVGKKKLRPERQVTLGIQVWTDGKEVQLLVPNPNDHPTLITVDIRRGTFDVEGYD